MLVEVLFSAVMLSVILMGGFLVSKSAMVSTEQTVVAGEADARATRAMQRVHLLLRPAGRSTLEAIPGGGTEPEPMQDGVHYDNVRFRQVLDYRAGEPIYEPEPPENPFRVFFESDVADPETGSLIFDDGERQHKITSGVRDVVFEHTENRITLRFTLAVRQGQGVRESMLRRSVVLRSP